MGTWFAAQPRAGRGTGRGGGGLVTAAAAAASGFFGGTCTVGWGRDDLQPIWKNPGRPTETAKPKPIRTGTHRDEERIAMALLCHVTSDSRKTVYRSSVDGSSISGIWSLGLGARSTPIRAGVLATLRKKAPRSGTHPSSWSLEWKAPRWRRPFPEVPSRPGRCRRPLLRTSGRCRTCQRTPDSTVVRCRRRLRRPGCQHRRQWQSKLAFPPCSRCCHRNQNSIDCRAHRRSRRRQRMPRPGKPRCRSHTRRLLRCRCCCLRQWGGCSNRHSSRTHLRSSARHYRRRQYKCPLRCRCKSHWQRRSGSRSMADPRRRRFPRPFRQKRQPPERQPPEHQPRWRQPSWRQPPWRQSPWRQSPECQPPWRQLPWRQPP